MPEALAMLASAWLTVQGFALLALSQERHFEAVYGSSLPRTRRTRIQRMAGFIMIGLGLPLCIASEGPGLGSLLWMVMITAAAMAVTFTLSWQPRWLRVPGFLAAAFAGRGRNGTAARAITTSKHE